MKAPLGRARGLWAVLTVPAIALAQPPARPTDPFQTQSATTVAYGFEDGSPTVEITNVAYELAGPGIPGRARDEFLLLRMTSHSKQIVDEIGLEAAATIEAWPLGIDPKRKPVYLLTVPGIDPKIVGNGLILISRGLEEVEWWSVYKLGNAEHLFDTYVPLVQFPIGTETQEQRYVGLEVPPDDVDDARLKAPNVVAVLTYASADRVIREALLTAEDPALAILLRSYADSTRTMTFTQSVQIMIRQNFPLSGTPRQIEVPIAGDDLDLAHARLPAGLRIAAWKR